MSTVLVVDDKEMMRDSVGATLRRAGFGVIAIGDSTQVVEHVAQKRPDVIVSDLRMPGMTGIELIEKIREIDDELPVVLMTAFGTIETAVKAIKLGAFDYITKPFEGDELIIAVKRALKQARLTRENAILRAANPAAVSVPSPTPGGTPSDGPTGLDRIIGDSPAMRRVKQQVAAVAASQGTVLITGESGAGKEVVSRAVHDLSPRTGGPFLAVNCAALNESVLESELFGHEKGAFTGAEKTRKGRFELAHAGTLVLDEVSEISPQIQAKLLRVLQERAFERVGSSTTMGVDVRVIATSNRDLPGSVADGDFRQDLYYRLNVLPIELPALRERLEDVPLLAAHFLRQVCEREGMPLWVFDDDASRLLQSYDWPGNVRELQNICERAAVLSRAGGASNTGVIGRSLIEPWIGGRAAPTPPSVIESKPASYGGGATLEEIEREAILAALERHDGHRQRTAEALGIGVRTLGLKLKRWKELRLVAPTL